MIADAAGWLDLGLVNLIHLFNPRAIVLGRSVMQLGDLLLDPAEEVIRENLLDSAFYHENLLQKATIEDDVCLVGAALHCINNV